MHEQVSGEPFRCDVSALRMQSKSRSAGFSTLDKQRSFPPRNCTCDVKCAPFILLVTEQRRDGGDIGRSFRRKRLSSCEMLFIPRRTRVIGRKEAHLSEAVVHLPEIRGARKYVVARIKGVEAEACDRRKRT